MSIEERKHVSFCEVKQRETVITCLEKDRPPDVFFASIICNQGFATMSLLRVRVNIFLDISSQLLMLTKCDTYMNRVYLYVYISYCNSPYVVYFF